MRGEVFMGYGLIQHRTVWAAFLGLCIAVTADSASAQSCSPFGSFFSKSNPHSQPGGILNQNPRFAKELNKIQTTSARQTARATKLLRAEYEQVTVFEDRARKVPQLCLADPQPGDEVMTPDSGPLLDLPSLPGIGGPADLYPGPIFGIASNSPGLTGLVKRSVVYKERWYGCKNNELLALKAKVVAYQARLQQAQKRFQVIDQRETLKIQRLFKKYSTPTTQAPSGSLWQSFISSRISYIKCLLLGGL